MLFFCLRCLCPLGKNVPKISNAGRVLRHYPMNFYKLIPTCHTKLM